MIAWRLPPSRRKLSRAPRRVHLAVVFERRAKLSYYYLVLHPTEQIRRACSNRRSLRPRGFTLIELLVIVGNIAILAALLLPALAKGKLKAQAIQCMNNHRQLCLAWRMSSDDNHERLLYASGRPDDPRSFAGAWVTGTLDFSSGEPLELGSGPGHHQEPDVA